MIKKSRLKELRIKEGITATKLANKSNLSTKTIARAESNEEFPTEVTLYRILKALNELSNKNYRFNDIFI